MDQVPTKDRFPPRAYDPQDPRRKLAVLIDVSRFASVDAFRSIDPKVEEVGAPILYRFFDTELRQEWKDLLTERPSFEWFRVERFIPIHMQMAADAHHIADHCRDNKIQGIVYVVSETDKYHYEQYFDRLRGKGLNQYIFDENGLAAQTEEDGREGDGAPR